MSKISKKRIPTILGILVLVSGLGLGLYLVGRATIIPRATAEETPKAIKITNVSDNSFTISWLTDVGTIGFVKMGENVNSLDKTIGDDRDQLSGSVGSFTTHQVTLRGLTANSTYFFKLGSGAGKVLFDNNGQPYSVKTPAVLESPPAADTVYGNVFRSGDIAAENSLVYLTLPNGSPMSSLVKASGNWAIPLSTARTQDLIAYATYDVQATTVEIFVQGDNGQTATAVTVTANDSPVPPITLGNSYDFRSDVTDVQSLEGSPGELPPGADLGSGDLGSGEQSEESPEASGGGFLSSGFTPGLPTVSTFKLEILNPSEEGEKVATVKPEIFGTSPKNVTLDITVQSPTVYDDEIEVGNNGLWQWSPPQGLDPGEHTVTVSYLDTNGILQKASKSFVVLAAGDGNDLPAFESTPSATVSPSPTSTASASGDPRVSQPSTESGVPVAGVLTPTLTVFILGLVLLAAGVYWQLRLN